MLLLSAFNYIDKWLNKFFLLICSFFLIKNFLKGKGQKYKVEKVNKGQRDLLKFFSK